MSKTILIVDDDAALARGYQRLLTKQGFSILLAGDVEQAWKILNEGTIDLCITDLALPGASGLDFIKQLRADKRYEKLPIIVQSGFGESMWKEFMPYHPLRIFQKPVPMEDLLWTIRDGLGIAK